MQHFFEIAWHISTFKIEKWQPTSVFLPGKSHDRGAWWATVHGVAESDMIKQLTHTPNREIPSL